MGVLGQLIGFFSKGPSIQNLENFDMVVEMKDGGIILPIICHKHLDSSDEALSLLQIKIGNYIRLINSPELNGNFMDRAYILVELSCTKKPDQRILDELDRFKEIHEGSKLRFSWKK